MYNCVVAIDFGSTDTVVGFSTTDDPLHTHVVFGQSDTNAYKAPTSILLDAQEQFVDFGWKAETLYSDAQEHGNGEGYRLFRGFMNLEEDNGVVIVKDLHGFGSPASTIISLAISYVLRQLGTNVGCDGITVIRYMRPTFVFAVPATWNSSYRKCIMEAAVKAGIPANCIMVIADDEAASVMCQEELKSQENERASLLGSKTLIVSIENRVIGLSVLETRLDGTLRVNILPGRDDCLTNLMSHEVVNLLATLCNETDFTEFNTTLDYECLRNIYKKSLTADGKETLTIALPVTITEKLNNDDQLNSVRVRGNKIRIDKDVVNSWLMKSTHQTEEYIRSALQEPDLQNVSDIILIGDFFQNNTIMKAMKSMFEQRIIVPSLGRLAVVQGSVIYGHFPGIVASRMVRTKANEALQLDLNRRVMLEDINGKEMPAITIFAMAIGYLRGHLVKNLQSAMIGVEEKDILFVLTVPAIWNDAAKQFMKEAAIMAGIEEERVCLALEPEAAAVWCQHVQTDITEKLAKAGTQFMVVDLGGGTADICVQERLSGRTLKEIHRASGGPWGGTQVDQNYYAWLAELLGEETMLTFQKEAMNEHFNLQTAFELKKRSITTDTNDTVRIQLVSVLPELHKKVTGMDLKQTIKNKGLSDAVAHLNNKLKVDPSVAKSWFSTPVENIVRHVSDILKQKKMKNVKTVLLVGGFAECTFLQKAIRTAMGNTNRHVIIPHDASVAVLKGAVEFGLNQNIISRRVMRYTYGISKEVPFNRALHLMKKSRVENGKRVVDMFERFISIGSEIEVGEIITTGFVPTNDLSTKLGIYCSWDPDPTYVSDECIKIGELTVPHPEMESLKDKIFTVHIEFGRTEMSVKVLKQMTGEEISTNINCL